MNLKSRILKSSIVLKMVSLSKSHGFPGSGEMNIYEVMSFLSKTFKKSGYGIRSAAISFKFFMAMFPTIIFALSLIPLIPIANFQDTLISEITKLLPPELSFLLESTINDLVLHKHNMVLSLGFFLTIFYASSGINTMLTAFNSSHQLEIRTSPVKQRLFSLTLFAFISLLFAVAFSALIYGESLVYSIDWHQLGSVTHFLFNLIKWIVVISCMIIAISSLYYYGAAKSNKFKLFTAGGSLSTTTILLASYGLMKFFGNFGQYNELYGSIGSLIMILIWLNVVSYVLLIGFELNTKIESVKD